MTSSLSKKMALPGPQLLTIKVTKTNIEYQEDRSAMTGYLTVIEGDPPMSPDDRSSVLHLLFHLVYTQAGRSLLLDHPFDRDERENLPAGATRASLKAALRLRFPSLADDRLEIAL